MWGRLRPIQDVKTARARNCGDAQTTQAARMRLDKLLRQGCLDGRTLRRPVAECQDFRKSCRIDAVAFQKLRKREQIRVADGIGLAHDPRTREHLALDQAETLADGLRHLSD
jgi:hypothetical protein